MLQRKNARATAVLAIVMAETEERKFNSWSVEPYLNGRESGYAIADWHRDYKAVFSEFRRSDSIVVYLGKTTDFSMQGNSPNDEVYKDMNLYGPDGYVQAARAIIAHLDSN